MGNPHGGEPLGDQLSRMQRKNTVSRRDRKLSEPVVPILSPQDERKKMEAEIKQAEAAKKNALEEKNKMEKEKKKAGEDIAYSKKLIEEKQWQLEDKLAQLARVSSTESDSEPRIKELTDETEELKQQIAKYQDEMKQLQGEAEKVKELLQKAQEDLKQAANEAQQAKKALQEAAQRKPAQQQSSATKNETAENAPAPSAGDI